MWVTRWEGKGAEPGKVQQAAHLGLRAVAVLEELGGLGFQKLLHVNEDLALAGGVLRGHGVHHEPVVRRAARVELGGLELAPRRRLRRGLGLGLEALIVGACHLVLDTCRNCRGEVGEKGGLV
jgi:hypothetical protein